MIIPEDNYFVLGYSRSATFDSRHFGLMTRNATVGKVLSVYQLINSTQDLPFVRRDSIGLNIR